MAELVQPPDLDIRNAAQIAAQAIAFTSGGLTVERVEHNIAVQRELLTLLETGDVPSQPSCPELTNANPSSTVCVLLEAAAWLLSLLARKVNILPVKVQVEFARLFRVELREATKATATLKFTVAPPEGLGATVPAGTAVSTADGRDTFVTDEELVLAAGVASGEVSGTSAAPGALDLSAGQLVSLADPVAWVSSVTNELAVGSGSDAETIESALARARRYQLRGERLVTHGDLESAVLDDVLLGNGVVKAFPFIKDGDYAELLAGHTTLVVMTRAGASVGDEAKRRIAAALAQAVGNQFIYVKDPAFVDFDISADVRLTGLVPQDVVLASVARRLAEFYAPTTGNFGKSVYQSDIIGLIEGSEGVERIERQPGGDLLVSPEEDLAVAPYELPRLVSVTLTPVP
jgi:hypothetical protein